MNAKEYVYRFMLQDKVSKALGHIARVAGITERKIDKLAHTSRAAEYAMGKLRGMAGKLKNQFVVLFSVAAIASFGKEVVQTTSQIQGLRNAIYYASGSAEEGNKNWKFLSETSKTLGMDVMASREGFKTLSAAMMGSKLAGQPTRDIFLSVSKAAAAMNLDAETSKGAFLALGQMMGKGKVSAEELRGQLGERIPGAFQVAARAMNMTTAQLDKFMSDGKLMAEDFLPKFAAELEKTYGDAVNPNSLQGNISRAKNSLTGLMDTIGKRLTPVVIGLSRTFVQAVDWMREHKGQIVALKDNLITLSKYVAIGTAVFLAYKTGIFLVGAATLAWSKVTMIARIASIAFTQSFARLNMVLNLNPISLIVTAVAALAFGFAYAYQKSEDFRGAIWGIWEAAKQVGQNLMNWAKSVIYPIIDAWKDVKSGNILSAGNKLGDAFKNAFTNWDPMAGTKDAFNKGFGEGKDKVIKVPEVLQKFLGNFDVGEDKQAYYNPEGDAAGLGEDTTFKDGINSVAGGGQKVMHVDIDIEKLQLSETMQVQDLSLEKIEEMSDQLREILMRVVNGALAKSR